MSNNKLNWETPLDKAIVEKGIANGLFKEETPEVLKSFLLNLEAWFKNDQDKLRIDQDIEDLGIEEKDFEDGNSPMDFRCLLINHVDTRPVLCLGFASFLKENAQKGSHLIIGVEDINGSYADIQLKITDSFFIKEDCVEIMHDCSNIGSANKDLIEYIDERIPDLVKENKIHLGTFNVTGEINSKNIDLTDFVLNVLNYVLIRQDFNN